MTDDEMPSIHILERLLVDRNKSFFITVEGIKGRHVVLKQHFCGCLYPQISFVLSCCLMVCYSQY